MKTAIDKVKEINDKTRAWVAEDPENRWAGLLTEETEHWAEYGIHTYEEMEHYLLVSDCFEGTRDVYGYKPDWSQLNSMSNEELEAELECISKAAARRYGEEQEQAAAIEAERQGIIKAEKLERARIRKEHQIRKNRSDNFGAMMLGDKLYEALTNVKIA